MCDRKIHEIETASEKIVIYSRTKYNGEKKEKGMEKAGLEEHIWRMKSCRSENYENYNANQSFI